MEERDDGRFCAHCTRVVHDVATMTRAEAIALARALGRGERICRRVSRRRSDGAILTAEGFLEPEAPAPRASKRLVAMATAGATALAACAGPETVPPTQAALHQPHPLLIAPLPPPATTATPSVPEPESHALPSHARGKAPEPEIIPPFPAPAVVAPIGPPPPPKKEKPAPPAKAKPAHHDLDITGGY